MKKILGISLVALFTVAPFAADAALTSQGYVDGKLALKQDKLTSDNQGTNVTISTDAQGKVTISAADTTYSTGNTTTAGLTKLYTGTGANDDGTMTQNAITTALGGKQDVSNMDTSSAEDDEGWSKLTDAEAKTKYPSVFTAKNIAAQQVQETTNDLMLLTERVGDLEGGVGQLAADIETKQDMIVAGTDGDVVTYSGKAGEVKSLGFDTTPTESSAKLVKSGAIKSYVDTAVASATSSATAGVATEKSRAEAAESALDDRLDVIEGEGAGSVKKAEADAKEYADSKVTALANGQVKTNKEAIEAINDTTNGVLAQAKADATAKANTAESNAKTYADGLNSTLSSSLGALAHLEIPASCKSSGSNCVLVYKGSATGFVLEDIERATDENPAEDQTTTLATLPKQS